LHSIEWDIAGDLGWPLTPNHPNFYISHCLSYLHSVKRDFKFGEGCSYQVPAYGQQAVIERGVVTSHDPFLPSYAMLVQYMPLSCVCLCVHHMLVLYENG